MSNVRRVDTWKTVSSTGKKLPMTPTHKDKKHLKIYTREEKKKEMSEGKNLAVVILLPTLLYQEIAFKLGKMFLQETQ